jgi:hypothetical protein
MITVNTLNGKIKMKKLGTTSIYPGKDNAYTILNSFESQPGSYESRVKKSEYEFFLSLKKLVEKAKLSDEEIREFLKTFENHIEEEREEASFDATYEG